MELTDDIDIDRKKKHNIDIIIDRLVIKPDIRARLTESVETAMKYANNLGYNRYSSKERTFIFW